MRLVILISILLNCFLGLSQSKYLKNSIKEQRARNEIIGTINSSNLMTIDHKTVSLKSFAGKFLIVDFWYTKCGPCFKQFPYMDSIKNRFIHDTALLFINICSESTEDDWRKVVEEKALSGLNLLDTNQVQRNTAIIGPPKPSGRGTVHDQMYLTGFPSYAFFNHEGRLMGATSVKPSDSLLFAFYMEGLLNNKTMEESLQIFISEIKKTEPSQEFNIFLQRRFGISGLEQKKILEPYRKYL